MDREYLFDLHCRDGDITSTIIREFETRHIKYRQEEDCLYVEQDGKEYPVMAVWRYGDEFAIYFKKGE